MIFFLSCLPANPAEAGAPPSVLEIRLDSTGDLLWKRERTPALMVRVRSGDGWLRLAKRYTGTTASAPQIHRANPSLKHPLRDRRIRIPLELLRADLRLQTARLLFPTDRRTPLGYRHWILAPFGESSESWKWLGLFFCGQDRSRALKVANPEMSRHGLRRARPFHIPEALLLPVFRELPVRPLPTPTPIPQPSPTPSPAPISKVPILPSPSPGSGAPARSASPSAPPSGALEYGLDSKGPYALYRLHRGEALYSAVVVRFTGQLHAKQVNATALEIARRSGIPDVTDIPVNHPIKIPLDLLLPPFLPPDDPRRLAWEKSRKELAGFLEVVRDEDLSGVQIILDAGHGGRDTGALVSGVWESTYVYDILCRVRQRLKNNTRARVWTTIEDSSRSFSIPGSNRLTQDRDQMLLTHPRYGLEDTVTGVHLRWYLANDIILDRIPKDTPRTKTVFISFHADSLHPSVRGAMVYVPARYLRPNSYQASSRGLQSRREFRNHPTVKLSSTFKARAEASSRRMASKVVERLREHQLPVHPNQPIRGRIIRGKRSWVPAVLRYSLAQNALLIETCNMSNTEDRKNLLDAQWREDFAQAIVEGIVNAFRPEKAKGTTGKSH